MMSVPVTHPESCIILLEVIRKLSPAQTHRALVVQAPIMICCAASTRTVTIKLMLLHGEVRHYDFSNLKQLNASMGRIAGSINQIAKRCNENKSVHANDVEQLRREFLELKADYLERVVKLLRKIY